ncbi:MAG: carboxypeptidase-like regulatory domain-containing protein [Gemmatimonadota bacterium]
MGSPFSRSARLGSGRRRSLAWLAGMLTGALPVHAQISGQVLEASTRDPVPMANVALVDSLGNVWAQVMTDSTGHFSVIPMTNEAVFDIQVIAMGYAGLPVDRIRYDGRPVHRIIGVVTRPMELEGLTVEVEGQDLRLLLFGFYERKERGFGHFIDEERIRATPEPGITGVLRGAPGLVVLGNREVLSLRNTQPPPVGPMGTARGLSPGPARSWRERFCRPTVFVNGSPDWRLSDPATNDFSDGQAGRRFGDFLPPKEEIIGVEVYRSLASLPRDMQILTERGRRSNEGSVMCGAILIWTHLDGAPAG